MPTRSRYLIPGESIILQSRPHLFVLFPSISINVLCLAVLAWAAFALEAYWILFFLVLPLSYLLGKAFLRSRQVYVVTDRRVIRREGFLTITSVDSSLDMINNIYYGQSLLGRIFRFGDVTLESASQQGTIRLHSVPDPQRFKNTVLHQRDLYRTPDRPQRGAQPAESVPKLIEDLASLRDRGIISQAEFEEKKRGLLARL